MEWTHFYTTKAILISVRDGKNHGEMQYENFNIYGQNHMCVFYILKLCIKFENNFKTSL